MWIRYADDGTVIEGDDETRVALVDGVPRPYTAEENKAADALAADTLARAEHAAARAAVRGILDDIDAQQDRAREVIDSPSDVRTVTADAFAAELADLTAAVKDLARFARGLA